VRITLNRPDAANGMNDTMTRELADAARRCDADDELTDRARQLADQMASGPRKSNGAVKRLLLNSSRNA
jgi:enoyl-CoA hydratase/carnithine racemase